MNKYKFKQELTLNDKKNITNDVMDTAINIGFIKLNMKHET